MKRKRRSFSTDSKHDAAALALDQGYSIAQAYRSLDIGETALRCWINQLQSERAGVTPSTEAMSPDQRRIQELEKRVRVLETEKRMLKKAAALLMLDEWNHTNC